MITRVRLLQSIFSTFTGMQPGVAMMMLAGGSLAVLVAVMASTKPIEEESGLGIRVCAQNELDILEGGTGRVVCDGHVDGVRRGVVRCWLCGCHQLTHADERCEVCSCFMRCLAEVERHCCSGGDCGSGGIRIPAKYSAHGFAFERARHVSQDMLPLPSPLSALIPVSLFVAVHLF